MPNFYILTQFFYEKKGSYYSFFENLARYAYSKGYKVTILCRNKLNKVNIEEKEYCKIISFPNYNFKIFNMIFNEIIFSFKIKDFFKKIDLKDDDIIVANGYTPLGVLDKRYILRVPDQPGKTIIKNLSIAKMPLLNKIFQKMHFYICSIWDKKIIINADALIFSSMANKKEFEKYFLIGKPFIIPNKSIDKIFLKIKNKKKLQELKSKFKGRNILFVSRADERIRKGVYYLEKILSNLFDKYKDINLIHVGDKMTWNINEKYLSRIKEVGNISYEEMPYFYRISDIFLITSISEGIPAALLEAISSGCCVVSSNLIGIDEYIVNNKSGVIFERGNEKDLLEKITYLLDNPKLIKLYSRNAKKNILKLKNYYKVFFEFLKNKKSVNLLI